MRSRILSGLAWKAGSKIVLQLSRFAVAVILARLLAPHDFGLAAMVLVLSGLVVVVGDSALGTALIQRRSVSEDDRSTIFWTGVGIGLAFTLAGIAAAGPVASFYDEPQVRPLFAALSLCFLVTAIGTTQRALLVREMDFRSLELRQVGGTFAGAAVGITIAANGGGAWAIVLQEIATAVASTLLLWHFSRWRPAFRFSLRSIRSIGSFTGNAFGQNLLYYAGRNTDNLLIGRYLGPSALGVYALAYNVMLAPFHHIGGLVQQVLFPAFSRMQDDRRRLAETWMRATKLVGAITIPALLGLIVVAPDFVAVVFGEKWHQAVPVLQILAGVGLIQSLQTLNGDVLLALGRAHIVFRYTVLWFVAGLISFVVGLQWGIIGVAAAYAVASSIVEPFNAWLTARAVDVSLWRFVRGFTGIAQAAAAMTSCVIAARMLLVHAGMGAPARLVTLIALGCVVYFPVCAWRAPDVMQDVRSVVRRRGVAAPRRDALAPAAVGVE
jgi:O-antigen/teichoic acid export membrane protein